MEDLRGDADRAFSASNGPIGVLVLHGFTGSPRSVRPLADAFVDAGFSVELPLLPGHGTSVEDLSATTFDDWAEAATSSFNSLAACSDHTFVAGLSMGGTLALCLALRHADIAGLILINPIVVPPADSFLTLLDNASAGGVATIPSIGGDTKRSSTYSGGYDATPIAPLLTLLRATQQIAERRSELTCPTLLFSSSVDHVVPTESSDLVEQQIGGPIERVVLENSFHIATLDNDAAELEERAVAFVMKIRANDMADKLTKDDVLYVARLARLALTDDEVTVFAGQLSAVLDHADALCRLDIDDVGPTADALALENVLRPDTVRPGCDRDEVLAEAPATEDGRFKVPRILGEEP